MSSRFNIRQGEIDRLQAEIDRLRAENAELKKLLERIFKQLREDDITWSGIAGRIAGTLSKTAKEEK